MNVRQQMEAAKRQQMEAVAKRQKIEAQRFRQLQIQNAALPTLRLLPNDGAHSQKGLANLGNTCYMNAVLQCLCRSTPFVDYLLKDGFTRDKLCLTNRDPLSMAFLTEFRSLTFKLVNGGAGGGGGGAGAAAVAPIKPVEIYNLLVLLNNTFQGNLQSDAQECLTSILQILHNSLKLNVKITISNGNPNAVFDQMRKGYKQYESHLLHDGYSVLTDLFGSQFQSKLTCNRCGHCWSTYDPYSLVPVEIAPKALSLYDCLDTFMSVETVDGVTCAKCASQQQCTKQFTLWTLPTVMIIQLKRFDVQMRKINQFVQAPRVLNISKYVSHPSVVNVVQHNPAALQLYDLKAIVCHTGQLQGGHYTAKVLCDPGNWYEFNDEHAAPIPEASIQSPQNYILFYEMTPPTKLFWKKK